VIRFEDRGADLAEGILEAAYGLTMMKLINEINPGVAMMKDSFHAVCGMRFSHGDSDLALKKRMVPLINRCCTQRKTYDNSENSHVSLVTAVSRELRFDSLNISSQLSYLPYWE